MLPDFKDGIVLPKDPLDIEIRTLLELYCDFGCAPGAPQNAAKVNYAPELMPRL